MEHWQNLSLENLYEVHEGILYTEEWKPIDGYVNQYFISSFGRVKSLGYNNHPEAIKAQRYPENGYLLVSLWKGNKEKKALVHRLVALAFIKNPENKKTVNHKKGIKTDNRYHQLEWATQGENARHSYKELGRKAVLLGKTGKENRFSKPVNQYSIDGILIGMHDSITIAAEKIGTSKRNICHALLGNQKTAGGFKWEYVKIR